MKKDAILYFAFAIIGLLLTYNNNFSSVQEIKASPINTELPTLKFDPKGNFSLDLDMNKNTAALDGNLPISNFDVTVVQPVKEHIKKEVKYVTKIQYVEKFIGLEKLKPNPIKLHVSHIEIPNKLGK